MARAVATLEGDSSSLVDAIDKAKGSMQKLDVEGKKLTDQLRDVADEADKAAGALVNKIGGPTAIKAIAGVTAGFAAAQTALGIFSGSMSAFAATQGAAGQKAMADLDTALNELQGQLFTAVMGTDDMAEAMKTVLGVVEAATIAVQLALAPLTALSTLVRALGDDFDETAGYIVEASDRLDQLADATRLASLTKTATGIEGLRLKLMALRGETEALRQIELARDIASAEALKTDILASELQADALSSAAAVAGAQAQIQVKAEAARLKYLKDLGEEKLTQAMLADARRVYNNEMLVQGQLVMAQQMAQRKGVSQANQEQLDIIDQQIAGFKEVAATKEENTPTGGGGGKSTADRDALLKSLDDEAKIRADALIAQFEAERQLVLIYGDARKNLTDSAAVEEAQANKDRLDAKQAEALVRLKETEAAEKARIQATAEFEKQFDDAKKARDDAKDAEEKAAHEEKVNQLTAGFQEYGKLAGQQLAEGEKGAKVAEKLAKKALGAQISALGDKAMVEAAIYAAAFNPIAIPMAAAGVAAYAAAAALGAEGKKATTATPASAAPAAAPVNTAFNLRVDAAFADGESIARQFATMQRAAQRRGLVPAGA